MIVEVEIEGEGTPRRYRVRRDDGTLKVQRLTAKGQETDSALSIDWRAPEPNVYSLLVEGRSYDVHIDAEKDDEERLVIHLLSGVVRVCAADARRHRVARVDSGPDGMVQITAPMPGRVVKVLAPEGTEVKRGDGIIVLEAMKMENELKAPRDGTVTSVVVEKGQGIEGGALLATIE